MMMMMEERKIFRAQAFGMRQGCWIKWQHGKINDDEKNGKGQSGEMM